MKILAWYLPQFHSIPENDAWWGEGFTEWTNVRKAKALFAGHRQPRVPADQNYYHLLDRSTYAWQVSLAREHGVDGFCLYHYWFNGQKLLQKPAENILKWADIDFPFCFSWANEPWTRAWDGGDREILMPQSYGDESEWQAHFEYLSPFFLDHRYLKVDGRPVFLLYRSENITACNQRIAFWDQKCRQIGLPGIHVVETMNSFQRSSFCPQASASVLMEPMFSMSHDLPLLYRLGQKLRREFKIGLPCQALNYDFVWRRILQNAEHSDAMQYLGAFVDWDNTPRRQERGIVFTASSPEKFGKYFGQLLQIAKRKNTAFIFVNAWNEWAEGTYLEPDETYGTQYLQKIRQWSQATAQGHT